MRLAVKRDEGSIPGGGYHYMLHTMPMDDDFQAECYSRMGYVVFEVSDEEGAKLLAGARAALLHQIEVAHLTDKACPP